MGFHYTQLYYLTPYLYRTNQVLYVLKDVKEKFVHQNVKTFAKENTSLLAIKKKRFPTDILSGRLLCVWSVFV